MIDRRLMEHIEDVLAPLSARIQVTERDLAMPMLSMPDFSEAPDPITICCSGQGIRW